MRSTSVTSPHFSLPQENPFQKGPGALGKPYSQEEQKIRHKEEQDKQSLKNYCRTLGGMPVAYFNAQEDTISPEEGAFPEGG